MDGEAWDDMPNARRCAQDLARGFERWETVRATAAKHWGMSISKPSVLFGKLRCRARSRPRDH